jgi:ABC-type transporter Mla maintaining outer membrane lipid asymmetry permease subunit MlaE
MRRKQPSGWRGLDTTGVARFIGRQTLIVGALVGIFVGAALAFPFSGLLAAVGAFLLYIAGRWS